MTWHNFFQGQIVPYVVINSNIVSVRSEGKEPSIMFSRTFVILAIFACVYGSSFYNTGMYLSRKRTTLVEPMISNSYTRGCPPVRGDNPRALASGLSYVQVDKHGITILYHLHQCRPCTS